MTNNYHRKETPERNLLFDKGIPKSEIKANKLTLPIHQP